MLRHFVLRRAFCSAPSASTALQTRARALFDHIIDSDWVDADVSIAPKLEEAASVIDQYRPLFDPQAPPDALYHEMAALHRVQEAAAIVETLGNYAEKLIRTNEDHLGWLGNTTSLPDEEFEEPIQFIRDYVDMMNNVQDERVKEKIELDLGSKVIQLKSMLSIENFSAKVAPLGGDHIVTTARPRSPLPPGMN